MSIHISVVTIVFNAHDLLKGTMESVLEQTWPHIEYLIIDGASTDGTQTLIEHYAAQYPHIKWISEPDKGLYDAMNKGLIRATGEYVWFMNAGDHFHARDTVEKVALLAEETNADVLFGETMLVNDRREPIGLFSKLSTRAVKDDLQWSDYLGGMLVVHQSFVARRALAPAYRTDNLCADYDWCIHILQKSQKNVPTRMVLTDYLAGGISKKRHKQSLKDRFEVMRQHFGLVPTLLAHVWIVLRVVLHRLKRWGKTRY